MPKKTYNESCDCKVIHEDLVNQVKNKINYNKLEELASIFKIIGDSTRTKILYALDQAELCACDICSLLNMTQSAISHQMKVLKDARIVKSRREGKIVFYSLNDEHIRQLFNMGLEHINENNEIEDDENAR